MGAQHSRGEQPDLDAIHLSTALLVQHRFDDLKLATHGEELGLAAKAVGLRVLGERGA